jgi:salicylate hydroxylase
LDQPLQRADLLELLRTLAAPHMTLRLNSKVVSVDPHAPRVTLEGGDIIEGDLIIGADGIKSIVREAVVGASKPPIHTGDSAYRSVISTAGMLADPELKELADRGEMISWMGPGATLFEIALHSFYLRITYKIAKHIIGYCMVRLTSFSRRSQPKPHPIQRGKTEYNLVLVHPDNNPNESYMAEGSVAQMREDFVGWEPRFVLHEFPGTSFQ